MDLINEEKLRVFAEALQTLVYAGVIEREHAKALAKTYLKEHGFDVPRPVKPEEPKKEGAK